MPSIKAQNTENKTSRDDLCREDLTALVQKHNKAVSENLKKLEMQWKGFMYSLFDFYTTFNDRMINPSKYGIPETTFCGIAIFKCAVVTIC